jgi:hypothetical protein
MADDYTDVYIDGSDEDGYTVFYKDPRGRKTSARLDAETYADAKHEASHLLACPRRRLAMPETATEPMTTVTVKVTQEDIDKGDPDVYCRSPIALAINKAGVSFNDIDPENIEIYGANRAADINIALPASAGHLMSHFSVGEEISPFEFTIEVPTRYVRAI